MTHVLPNKRDPADLSPPEAPVPWPARLTGSVMPSPPTPAVSAAPTPFWGATMPRGSPIPMGASYTELCISPMGDPFPLSRRGFCSFFPPIYLLCGIWIKGPCHYLHGSNIPPLIDWTRRVIPVSDLPLITETIILRIHRLTFPVISGRSLSTLIGISSYINGDVSGVAGAALLH